MDKEYIKENGKIYEKIEIDSTQRQKELQSEIDRATTNIAKWEAEIASLQEK